MINDKNFQNVTYLKVNDQVFKKSIIISEKKLFSMISYMKFSNCVFEDLCVSGWLINFSEFNNCVFKNVYFRKTEIRESTFNKCRFTDCVFIKAEISDSIFIESQFIQNIFRIAIVEKCDFIETIFNNSDLTKMIVANVRCYKLNLLAEIKEFSDSDDFGDILKEINLASSDEE